VSKLFGSVRSKLWIAAACVLLLVVGGMTLPAPVPSAPLPPQERAAPLLEAEVERRQQLRIFEEIQRLGPRLGRHSVTIPADVTLAALPSDLMPPPPRTEPAGHGLIVSADGEVLTAAGALGRRESLQVALFDGRRVEAHVVAFDPDADLVLLRSDQIPRTDAAPWATTPPTAGMLSVAVSHVAAQVSVAPVFVMAAPDGGRVRTTTGDLTPGTPLFTTAGEVFAIAAGDGDSSAALVAPAVSRLRERMAAGQARRGALGLTFQPRDGLLLKMFPPDGVLVADVTPYGPAEDAGVEPGDVITAIGDTKVISPDAARQVIAALPPRSPVVIHLERAGRPMQIETTATSALGLRVRQIPRERDENGPAARLVLDAATREAIALLPHSRILSINGARVGSVDDARAVIRRTRTPLVLYIEDERGRFFRAVERPR
jgi:S1-C subfamily serine protease